jgi:hypothetical protein
MALTGKPFPNQDSIARIVILFGAAAAAGSALGKYGSPA